MRRGMSYGRPLDRGSRDPAALKESLKQERGLVFMAFNANLGEQFELVQRWLNGGNSSSSYSGQSDPFFGVAEPGRRRYFRFEHQGQTVRMALDGSDRLHEEPRPFVRLEWGAYLFAPSRKALASLRERAAAQKYKRPVTWSADAGEKEIARLREIETRLGQAEAIIAWKSALEDPDAATDFTTASIWAAIRERHGGVLRTPYGVLVAERNMVEHVLLDPDRNLSVHGYLPRMQRSFGEIYLGLDAGQGGTYARDSQACNDAIMHLDLEATFQKARQSTRDALEALVKEAKDYATQDGETRWELTLDARELVEPLLTAFCEEWFGLSEDGGYFRRSGYRWDWQPGQPPTYPGHFLAPSRYFFQPRPGPKVADIGEAHGVALRSAMLAFLHRPGAQITAPVARAVLNSAPGKNLDFAARTIIGAVIGFVPTVDGNLRRILNEWLHEGTLWSLRARLGGTQAADFTEACNRLRDDFIPAMQLRAVPELLWRTATISHTLGEVAVNPGDIVVASAISATQQSLQEGRPELHHAFGGGNRRAEIHPTHACPGADPALAVMLGFFSALVESPLPLRVGPGPLTFALDGRLPPPGKAFYAKTRATVAGGQAFDFEGDAEERRKLSSVATPLMAIGDSWLFDQWERDYGVMRPNLVKSLLNLGYKDNASSGTFEFASAGRGLKDMAKPSFLREATNYLADNPSVKALLFGGGGNDVVAGPPGQQPLYKMLKPLNEGGLDEAEVSDFIDGTLFNHYDTVIKTLTENTGIPILIHGYDHPIPDDRGDVILIFHSGPWLQPFFQARGYDIIHNPQHLTVAREIMQRLIDRLNAAVQMVAAAYPNRVYHVKLTGTLAANYGAPGNYKQLWRNELHANEPGFDLLAAVIAKKLKQLNI